MNPVDRVQPGQMDHPVQGVNGESPEVPVAPVIPDLPVCPVLSEILEAREPKVIKGFQASRVIQANLVPRDLWESRAKEGNPGNRVISENGDLRVVLDRQDFREIRETGDREENAVCPEWKDPPERTVRRGPKVRTETRVKRDRWVNLENPAPRVFKVFGVLPDYLEAMEEREKLENRVRVDKTEELGNRDHKDLQAFRDSRD